MSATSAEGLLAVCGSFMGLSTIAVGLRIYGRRHQGVSLGLDDWTALFGVVTYIGACALAIELVVLKSNGYGTASLTAAQLAARAKPVFGVTIAYDFLIMNTLTCAKLSALFLYRRLFSVPPYSYFNATILVTVAVVIAWCITFDILSCLQCRSHFSAYWDGTFRKYCDLNPVWAKGLAFSDFLLDLWVFLLPIPTIWRLRMSTAKKLSVIGVFLLALVGVGASIARIVIFYKAKAPGPQTLYIGVLEAGMIITVVNLPSIWYICTSSIPIQLRRSLAGFGSLKSFRGSQASRRPSGDTSNTSSVYGKPTIVSVKSEKFKETQPRPQPPARDFRKDLETGGFEASATGGTGPNETGRQFATELPANIIHVQNEVEVKRDQVWSKK